jgi:hypothetical protein
MARSQKSGVKLQWSTWSGAGVAAVTLLACAEPTRSISADTPRTSTPVPACVLPLSGRGDAQRGFVRQLTDDQQWQVVFPTYDTTTGLPDGALTCTGEPIFGSPLLAGSRPRHPFPFKPMPGDLRFGSAPSRVKIIWYKTHGWDEATAGGPLALVRATEDFAEAYSIGVYRGSAEQTRLSTERLAGDLAVVATDDGCAGKSETTDCESTMHVFIPWKGQLIEQASIALERRVHLEGGEPGVEGTLFYRLVSSPRFEGEQIRLLEQVSATDEFGKKLRTMELERSWRLENGKLLESAGSLWEKMLPRAREPNAETPPAIDATAASSSAPSTNSPASTKPASTPTTPSSTAP